MDWQEFTALLVLATAMSFTPGPNTTLAATLGANGGMARALLFVCAVPVGWSLLLLVSAAGVGALVAAVPSLRWLIKGLGIGYLLWLALRLARSNQSGQGQSGSPSLFDCGQLAVGFGEGVLLQFVNIKAWLLALTLVAGWIAGRADTMARFALVTFVMMVYAFASNFSYALAGALLRNWLSQGQRLAWFNRAMAAVLVLTAGWLSTT